MQKRRENSALLLFFTEAALFPQIIDNYLSIDYNNIEPLNSQMRCRWCFLFTWDISQFHSYLFHSLLGSTDLIFLM